MICRRQCWRLISAPFVHQSFLHLILNATTIWSCRIVESKYGSLFYLRYSLLLIVSEALISFLIIYYVRTVARVNSQFQIASHTLTNVQSLGCSGLILGWLAFLSCIHGPLQEGNIIILGFFNVSQWYAPLIMILVYHICLLRGNLLYNWAGLCSGYLLGLGLLRILPDFYWSMCFILDVAFIVIASIVAVHITGMQDENVAEMNRSRSFTASNHSNDDLLEVLSVPVPPALSTNSSSTAYRTVDTNDFDVEEVKSGEDPNTIGNSNSIVLPDAGRWPSSVSSSVEGSRELTGSAHAHAHHRVTAGSRFIRQYNDEDRRDSNMDNIV